MHDLLATATFLVVAIVQCCIPAYGTEFHVVLIKFKVNLKN